MKADALEQELRSLHEQIAALTREQILEGPAQACRAPFAQLDRLAATPVDDAVVEQLLGDPALAPVWPAISRLRSLYNLRLELEQARALLEVADPWQHLETFHFWENYRALARMEVTGASLSPADRVVFLGCGPLPLSLVVLHRHHGVEGVGIERDPRLADLAEQVVARLGLEGALGIVTGDHHALPLAEPVTLIMVAAAAEPKAEVFAHLVRVLPPGSLLSYRICEKGARRLLQPDPALTPPPELAELRRVRPEPPVNNTVVVMRRR